MNGPITASKKPRAVHSGASARAVTAFCARSGSVAIRLALTPIAISTAITPYDSRQPKWLARIRIAASLTSTAMR